MTERNGSARSVFVDVLESHCWSRAELPVGGRTKESSMFTCAKDFGAF